MKRFSLTLLLVAILGNFRVSAETKAIPNSNLVVTIQGLQSQRGQVCLSLFADGKGFPSRGDDALQARCVKISSTPVVVTFKNLRPGNYAVAAFHDVNGDGKLHQNFLGIPTEEFGFSQNPQIIAGAPNFGDSAVLVVGPETDIQIQLQNLMG